MATGVTIIHDNEFIALGLRSVIEDSRDLSPGRIVFDAAAARLIEADTENSLFIVGAGAVGSWLNGPSQRLIEALGSVLGGGLWVCPALRERMQRELNRAGREPSVAETFGLTPRQLDVATLVGEGLLNPNIGDRLGIEASTVVTHCREIRRRLGLDSRNEIMCFAWQNGLSTLKTGGDEG